jgi:hypothetical protein
MTTGINSDVGQIILWNGALYEAIFVCLKILSIIYFDLKKGNSIIGIQIMQI